jgi:hypothetical protein
MNADVESQAAENSEVGAGYAQILRIIGSALEEFQVESFDLEVKDNEYYIRGCAKTVNASAVPGERSSQLTGAWRKIRNRFFSQPSGVSFELHYTQENLRTLDLEGRAQRGSSAGYPNAQSLTETLRSAGGFLDSKRANLSALSMRGRWITLHYKSPQGHLVVEEHTAISLYNFWISMCARRANTVEVSRLSGKPKHFQVDAEELE